MFPPNNPRRSPLLCYASDRRSLRLRPGQNHISALLEKVVEISATGVDWIQIREKDLSGRESATLVNEAIHRCAADCANAARIVVNDRFDVALSERAAGIHLGERSLPLLEVKKILNARPANSEFLIGVSCHSLEAARSAEQHGASYVFFGPVFSTPSKAAFGPPQGLAALERVSRALAIPVLAIGGITLENVSSCISAGASGLAAIRLFQDASDVSAVIRTLRQIPIS